MFPKYKIKRNGLGQYGIFKRFLLFSSYMLTPWNSFCPYFDVPREYILHCSKMRNEIGVDREGFFEKYEDAVRYLESKELDDSEKKLRSKFKEMKK